MKISTDMTSKVNLVKEIANLLRGPYTSEKYGNVIIPMAIIRRFDCILESKNKDIKALLAQMEGKNFTDDFLEDLVSKKCGVPFFNRKCISLENLVGNSDNIDANFLEFVTAYSPGIQKILAGLKFREEILFMSKKKLLFPVVKSFSEVDFHPETTDPLAMGYIFEEIIRTYKANAEAGDHYTPREVIELCVDLMISENTEEFKKQGKVLRVYDGCCGTGGMLTVLKRKMHELTDGQATVRLFGQDSNPEAYAVCRAEMLMLGEAAENIYEGDTLTEDRLPQEKFDLLLTNPPFGVEWKTARAEVLQEANGEKLNEPKGQNRFSHGLPRISDGQLLFLQNLLAKAEDDARIAIILNGSPLFSGDAESGESKIRQYVLTSGLLEAIVALPDQMFYNTGISTYIWILSKKRNAKRGKKVQLINAVDFFEPQKPKSLGNKRKYISRTHRRQIVKLFKTLADNEQSKFFDPEDFGYTKVTIERPLRLKFIISEENIAELSKDYNVNFAKMPPKAQQAVVKMLKAHAVKTIISHKKFVALVEQAIRSELTKIPAKVVDEIVDCFKEVDQKAEIVRDAKGNAVINPALRDTESIPLKRDINEYIKNEVLPFVPDALPDFSKNKIGYEIPFTRYFYKYTPPRHSADIKAELLAGEKGLADLLEKVLS